MAEEETLATIKPSFPTQRVKKIVKLDKDINKITSEAMFLISSSTELFLHFLAEKSAEIAFEKKRKTVKYDHLRVAVKRHQPTRDFLLDSLPPPSQPSVGATIDRDRSRPIKDKHAPANTPRIDTFFRKSGDRTSEGATESENGGPNEGASTSDCVNASQKGGPAEVDGSECIIGRMICTMDTYGKVVREADTRKSITVKSKGGDMSSTELVHSLSFPQTHLPQGWCDGI